MYCISQKSRKDTKYFARTQYARAFFYELSAKWVKNLRIVCFFDPLFI